MEFFVQVWCDYNPRLHLKIERSEGDVQTRVGDQLMRVNPVSILGVHRARELMKNPGSSRITVFSLGDGHQEALIHGMAAGAHRGIVLKLPEDISQECLLSLSSCFLKWLMVQNPSPDILIGDRVSAIAGFHLGMNHLAGMKTLELSDELPEKLLTGIRPTGKGGSQKVFAKLPAVIRLSERADRFPYISRDRLNHYRSCPFTEVNLASSEWESLHQPTSSSLTPFRPRTKQVNPPGGKTGGAKGMDRFNALVAAQNLKRNGDKQQQESPVTSVADQAEELVRYLYHHELIYNGKDKNL